MIARLMLLLLICLLASCQAAPGDLPAVDLPAGSPPAPPAGEQPTPFQPLPPTAQPDGAKPDGAAPSGAAPGAGSPPEAAPTVTAAALPTCQERAGRVEARQETFSASGPFYFHLYLPPCFDPSPGARYPVLYMIHGQTYTDDQWPRLGIAEAADALIGAGQAPPFLIVMPREMDTFADIYVSSFHSDLIDGLIPWIDANYPTCASRACRAIGGLSRGGAWALHLGLRRWELFGAIGLHSTPPFNTDPSRLPGWLQAIPPDQLPRIYLDSGRGDAYLSMSSALAEQLMQAGVPHEWFLFNGVHDEAYWSAHVGDYLAWYAQPWREMFPAQTRQE